MIRFIFILTVSSSNEESLIFFFNKLFTQLQNLGTVPAMV